MLKETIPTANPLAVFNMRRLDFCPPHFQTMSFTLVCDERIILNWIYEHTEGRFFFGTGPSLIENWRFSMCVSFENHSELSYFSLLLHQFNVPNSYF